MNSTPIFSLIEAETHEFSDLLKLSGLDPAGDLVGGDFSHVDFGSYEGKALNLSGCNLSYANLKKVRSDLILDNADIEGTQLPERYERLLSSGRIIKTSRRIDVLKTALLLVHRFNVSSTIPDRIAEDVFGNRFLCAEFSTIAEQDKLIEDVFTRVKKACSLSFFDNSSSIQVSGLLTHSYDVNLQTLPENGSEYFLRALEGTKINENSFISIGHDELLFANIDFGNPSNALARLMNIYKGNEERMIFIFSGYPPITKELLSKYHIRKNTKIMMVFLVPSRTFELYRNNRNKSMVDMKFLQRDWRIKSTDVDNFKGRLRRINQLGLTVRPETINSISEYLGLSQSILKNHFLKQIFELAKKPVAEQIL